MSKPLATKVSTPLNETVQIGHKVSIFCVATIIIQHFLNPLGHGVHQSFTGCNWSPLPLLHDDITELVDVRDCKPGAIMSAPPPLERTKGPPENQQKLSLAYVTAASHPVLTVSSSSLAPPF